MSIQSGRNEFEVRPDDRDYSGLSIENRFLSDANIERSFFNGVNLVNCAFDGVKMNNTEFSEANIRQCAIFNSDLSGSDFVDSLFEQTTFVNCNFEKGEWRGAIFRHCKFKNCNFFHTTVTLCVFSGCEFDTQSIKSAEHRAIYFNVFSRSAFGEQTYDVHFASRNFGVPARGNYGGIVHAGSQISIEQLCLLNNVGGLRAIDVAGVAESICASLATGLQRRTSTLIFFSKIVRVLTEERRISSTSLIYLEITIASFAGSVDDQDLFTAAMTAVIEIRSALFSIATETLDPAWAGSTASTKDITIHFSETYGRRQAEILRETLADVAGANPEALAITSFRNGSTIIELISANTIAVGALLMAINFVLRQANVTVRRWRELKRTVQSTQKPKRTTKKAGISTGRTPSKVPAVLKTGPVLPELAPVRAAVNRYGRDLVEMDERADVTVMIQISTEQMHRG